MHSMKLADGIRKHGFRKWYERELLQSHAHMVLTFLCSIGIVGAFEGMGRFRAAADQVNNLIAIVLCTAIGIWALRRYLRLLSAAEAIANQADCPQCETYGRFTLVNEDRRSGEVEVRCRKCERQWRIVPPEVD
jgi:hypothetical protein